MPIVPIHPEDVQITENASSTTIKVPGVVNIRVTHKTNLGKRYVTVVSTEIHDEPANPEPERFVGVIANAGLILQAVNAYKYGLDRNNYSRWTAGEHGRIWTYRVKPGSSMPDYGDAVNILGGYYKDGLGTVVAIEGAVDPRTTGECMYVHDVSV